ncbi:MAG: hypothetical protein NTX25_23525, partial [Proteobacteria bacterium]|nr:hypothetical protein [Pseudomonadota bacterium]
MIIYMLGPLVDSLSTFGKRRQWLNILGFFSLGLLFLSRVDNAIMISLLIARLVYCSRHEPCKIASMLTIAAIPVVPYLIYNELIHGAILPISGAVKSTFPHSRSLFTSWKALMINGQTVYMALDLFAIARIILIRRRQPTTDILLVSAIFCQWYYLLFQHASAHSWYYVQPLIAIAAALPSLAEVFSKPIANVLSQKNLGWIAASIALAIGVASPLYAFKKYRSRGTILGFGSLNTFERIDYPTILREKFGDRKESVFVTDFPGNIAYFSQFETTARDGLTLNRKAYKEMQTNFDSFIANRNITSVIWYFPQSC